MWQKFSEMDIDAVMTNVMLYLPNVIIGIIILAALLVFVRVVQAAMRRALNLAHVPQTPQDVLIKLTKYALIIIGVLTILHQLGVNITSLVAGLGLVGLAISLAAQDTLGNLIAGMTILIDKPFRVDDWVELSGMHANVRKINLRTTILRTFDNQMIVMPNKQILLDRIINYTLEPRIRVKVQVGIAYKEDIRTAREVMLSTTQGDERILHDPEPMVVVTELGASSVNLEMRFWVEDSMILFFMRFEYIEKCKYALDAAGIQIPYPHLQLFLEKTAAVDALASKES